MVARTVASSPIGLLEACDDRRLLGVKLYPRQRELLSVVEENPTTCALCGRQGGKTFCAACFLTHNLLLRPDLDEIAGGQTRWAVTIANSREQAGLLLGYVKTIVERSPLLRTQLVVDALDPRDWRIEVAEERPREAAGAGVDAVVRAVLSQRPSRRHSSRY